MEVQKKGKCGVIAHGTEFFEMRIKMEWISVKDRLPEKNEMVLTAIYGTDCIVLESGESLKDALKRNGKQVRVNMGFLAEDGWCGYDGFPEIIMPSYWMPLPEPPEEKG